MPGNMVPLNYFPVWGYWTYTHSSKHTSCELGTHYTCHSCKCSLCWRHPWIIDICCYRRYIRQSRNYLCSTRPTLRSDKLLLTLALNLWNKLRHNSPWKCKTGDTKATLSCVSFPSNNKYPLSSTSSFHLDHRTSNTSIDLPGLDLVCVSISFVISHVYTSYTSKVYRCPQCGFHHSTSHVPQHCKPGNTLQDSSFQRSG